MKAFISKLKSILLLGLFFSISLSNYAQDDWTQYSDSLKYLGNESVLKIPGVLTGNRYILSINDFLKLDKLDTKLDNISVKSFSIMTLGLHKGLIIKKCTGNEVDKTIKSLIKDQPFLGYRIIIYDIVYDKIDFKELSSNKLDATGAFILEILQ
jgi:hypothetical protein